MNLFLRFICLMLKIRRVKTKGFADASVMKFRVMPTDSDFYQHHLTNSRFASFADLGRIHWAAQSGIYPHLKKSKVAFIVSTAQSQFFGLVRWGKSFELMTQPKYWEGKYLYLEHRFISDEQLRAIIISRVVFHDGKKTVPVEQVWNDAGLSIETLDCPEHIDDLKQSLAHRF